MKGFLGSGSSSGSKGGSVDSLIGRQTEILGDVRFSGGLIRVPKLILNGTVIGDVHATEKLVLNAKARVNGNVRYRLLQMEPGATINGQLVHDSGEPAVVTRAESAVLALQDACLGKQG